MRFGEMAGRLNPLSRSGRRGAGEGSGDSAARDPGGPPGPVVTYPHDALVDPESAGVDSRALRKVVERLRDQMRDGRFPGAQIAVRRHGRLLLDEAIGVASGFRPGEERAQLARPDTPFPVFSAGKPLIGMTVALLEERGRLDVRAPIAEVIPEFGCRGKEAITTLDVLTHTGGILMPDFSRRWHEWSDWEKVVDAICAVRPSYPRGTLAYHPLEYGWVLGELVRRLTGRPLYEFLDEELLRPAGLQGMRFRVPPEEQERIANSYWLGGQRALIGSVNVAAMFREIGDDPAVLLDAFVPGAGLITDAAHLAGFYDFLAGGGVAPDGRRLLERETIRRYTDRHLYAWCRSNRSPLAVGRGFLVGAPGPGIYGWWDSTGCYGHAGAFCTVAFTDGATDLAIAVVTNGNAGPADMVKRFPGLLGRLRGVVRPHKRKLFT